MVVQQDLVRLIAENRRLIDDLIKPEIFPAVAAPVPPPVALNDMLIADATPVWTILTGPAAQGEVLVAGAAPFTQAWGTVDLLSLTHGDTTPQAVSRGSLIYGDAGPTWNELVIGALSTHLESDGVDVAWQVNITMADDAWIGLGGAAGRLAFDATPAPDQVEVTSADLNFVTAAHGIIHVDGVAAGWVLRADGTRYVPASAVATVPLPPVAQNDMLIADAVPEWSILTGPVAQGQVLVAGAAPLTPVWVTVFTANMTFDDGVGDSPTLGFVGGSNDDTVLVFLDDDAVVGDSDLVIRLVDAAGDSRLIIQDSALATVAYIDSLGNADFEAHVAAGADAAIDANTIINAVEVTTITAGIFYGVYGEVQGEAAAPSTADLFGVRGLVRYDTAQTHDAGIGVYGSADAGVGIAATIGSLTGGRFSVSSLDADVNSTFGVFVTAPLVDDGDVVVARGIHIGEQAITGTGSITTLTGLYISTMSEGGTNYAIFTNDGIVSFGDDVGIGTIAPFEQVEVAAPNGARVIFTDGGGANRKGILFDAPNTFAYGRILAHDYGAAAGLDLSLNDTDGNVGITATTISAKLHVDNISQAQPVLYLDQGDVSEEMIEFATTIGVGNAIEAVGAKTLTTTHFIKVTLPGALTRYFEVGTIA
jgi:hypothetical protein